MRVSKNGKSSVASETLRRRLSQPAIPSPSAHRRPYPPVASTLNMISTLSFNRLSVSILVISLALLGSVAPGTATVVSNGSGAPQSPEAYWKVQGGPFKFTMKNVTPLSVSSGARVGLGRLPAQGPARPVAVPGSGLPPASSSVKLSRRKDPLGDTNSSTQSEESAPLVVPRSGERTNPQRPVSYSPGTMGFPGMSQKRHNQQYRPTDSAIAIGNNGKGMLAINNAISVIEVNLATGLQAGPEIFAVENQQVLAPAFKAGFTVQDLSDPNLAFDPSHGGRFVFNIMGYNHSADAEGHFYLAVCASQDPMGDWYLYVLQTYPQGLRTSDGYAFECPKGHQTGSFTDYPQLALNADGVFITGMAFCEREEGTMLSEMPFIMALPKFQIYSGKRVTSRFPVWGSSPIARAVLGPGKTRDAYGKLNSDSYSQILPVTFASFADMADLGAVYPRAEVVRTNSPTKPLRGKTAAGVMYFASQDLGNQRSVNQITVISLVNTRSLRTNPTGTSVRLLAAVIPKGITPLADYNYMGMGLELYQPTESNCSDCARFNGGDFWRTYGASMKGRSLVISGSARVEGFADKRPRAGQYVVFLEPFLFAAPGVNVSVAGLALRRISSTILTQRTPYPLGLAFSTVAFIPPHATDQRNNDARPSVAISYTTADNIDPKGFPSASYTLFTSTGAPIFDPLTKSVVRHAKRGTAVLDSWRGGDYAWTCYNDYGVWSAVTYASDTGNMSLPAAKRLSGLGQWVIKW